MVTHELHPGALPVDVDVKSRDVTAPWILDHTGAPRSFPVTAGTGLYYDLDNKVVHLRKPEAGMSRTYAPEIDIYINHTDGFVDVSFRCVERPWVVYPTLQIQDGCLQFVHVDDFMASNLAMFQAACRYLNSPIYNPYLTAIEAPADRQYAFSVADGTITRRDGNPVDQMFSTLKSFVFRSRVPVPGFDRSETNAPCELPPGLYSAKVAQTDTLTGEVVRFEVESLENDNVHFCQVLVEHDDLFVPRQAGNVDIGDVEELTFLDLDNWMPKTFAPQSPIGRRVKAGGLLGSLFGRS
ncbi:hypothetical protein HOE425_340349 [Hoeflea sp. EC-HK425]|nr:hypothetical protein HOE425_340349 [Hoeflea sp. EC-HK425]